MRYRYGRLDINEISIGISIWDIDMGYGISIPVGASGITNVCLEHINARDTLPPTGKG